ncbi:MAG: beta-phosphoglucomutase family hydrolase [Bacteriovoracaceae bacterium]|nr:beta-phosphoglucomutase family hydrolase [Bacteriovoracaceae bacterium]
MQGDKAIILDMDGVLLKTHHLHALAWKKMFDEFLQEYALLHSLEFTPFDELKDYRKYVDGKPRLEGLKSFLDSRDITIPMGDDSDSESALTIKHLGEKKDKYYQELLNTKGPKVYKDSVDTVRKWTNHHVPLAVVSSSQSCKQVLAMGRIEIYFDTIVDPELASKQELKGKPEPDYFVHGAELLGFKPDKCFVVEDSQAGVKAAKKGGFAKVFGIVHDNDPEKEQELRHAGADEIIHSLSEIHDPEL